MSVLAAIKLLKTAKQVHDYVKKPNNLDMQNEMIIARIKKIEDKFEKFEKFFNNKFPFISPNWQRWESKHL